MTRERKQRTRAVKAVWVATLALVASGSILVVTLTALTAPPANGGGTLGGSGSSSSVSAPTSGNNGNTDPATGCNSNGNCAGHDNEFGVTVGTVTGLYPGRSTTVPVTYTNPNSFAIYVTGATLSATLVSSSAGTPACSASYLVTGTYPAASPGLLVAKNGSTATSLPVGLRATAPDACKRARWTITVTASGVK